MLTRKMAIFEVRHRCTIFLFSKITFEKTLSYPKIKSCRSALLSYFENAQYETKTVCNENFFCESASIFENNLIFKRNIDKYF